MPLNLDEKKAIVTEVRSMANDSLSLVIADARGVNVGAMTSLRSKARSEGVELRVVRNTLGRPCQICSAKDLYTFYIRAHVRTL